MPKRSREPSAFPRVNNHQTFSTFRLIPVINQKNYFTNYLKKDSQYMCRYTRERPEEDDSQVVVLQLGSRNLRIGFSDDAAPRCLPFNVAKVQRLYEAADTTDNEAETSDWKSQFETALDEVNQSFVDRMKFYKTRIIGDAKTTCEQFNARQKGDPVASIDDYDDDDHGDQNNKAGKKGSIDGTKRFCVAEAPTAEHNLYWPLHRGVLNEDPQFYRSPQELVADIHDILHYVSTSEAGLGIKDLQKEGKYDVVLVISDLEERSTLTPVVDVLFRLGYSNVAIIEEAVAATYGAGISAGCVVDIGAQTTTVSCVDDGACVSNSRVKLDFGSDDITQAWGRLLDRIRFPGSPDFSTLDALKQRFCTVNEADISVQLYQYVNRKQNRKYDFKVYNEVMLPVLGLFYPDLFTLPVGRSWRHTLFPAAVDAYTGHASDPISDADINVRLGTLAVNGQSYEEAALNAPGASAGAAPAAAMDDGDASMLDVDDADPELDTEMSRDGTPAVSTAKGGGDEKSAGESLSQLKAYESLDLSRLAIAPLDHAIIESITQACKSAGTTNLRQYYENLLVVGGGSKIPSFHTMLTDRLVMWNQSRVKELGDVGVMAMPRDMDAESICWRGGSVYSKLKIIDEMWTTKKEWDTLGSRTLHYKAALYMY